MDLAALHREEKGMTKADLVEQAADAIGRRITKRAARAGRRRLPRRREGRAGARRPHRAPGVRHLQGAAPQGPHRAQSQNRRTGRGSTACCVGLQAVASLQAQPGEPGLWDVRGGRTLRCRRWAIGPGRRRGGAGARGQEQGRGRLHALRPVQAEAAPHGRLGGLLGRRTSRTGGRTDRLTPPVAAYGTLLKRRSVMRGSIAAEFCTCWEKAGATRIPRTSSAATPLDSTFPR